MINVELHYSVQLPMMKTVHIFINMHFPVSISLDSNYCVFSSVISLFILGKVIF